MHTCSMYTYRLLAIFFLECTFTEKAHRANALPGHLWFMVVCIPDCSQKEDYHCGIFYYYAGVVPCGGSTNDLWPSNLHSLARYVAMSCREKEYHHMILFLSTRHVQFLVIYFMAKIHRTTHPTLQNTEEVSLHHISCKSYCTKKCTSASFLGLPFLSSSLTCQYCHSLNLD